MPLGARMRRQPCLHSDHSSGDTRKSGILFKTRMFFSSVVRAVSSHSSAAPSAWPGAPTIRTAPWPSGCLVAARMPKR